MLQSYLYCEPGLGIDLESHNNPCSQLTISSMALGNFTFTVPPEGITSFVLGHLSTFVILYSFHRLGIFLSLTSILPE
ncbi:hypothetical protein K439DRAFT_485924 [Ramaria rubella]|nr:hypothetical protein K439DRAFT_485924 [Ramaria rubella]